MERTLGELEVTKRQDFTSTHWTVVLAARRGADEKAISALETLCKTYWYPLYAFVRRRGHSPHDAEDLTQGFFGRLIEKNCLQDVHPSKGRFRAFLLASMKNYLANEAEKGRALKRGGNCWFESLDGLTAEERYAREPQDGVTPDALYDRRWALTLLGESLKRLRDEYHAAGKAVLFDSLKDCLVPGSAVAPRAALAERLGKSEEAVAMDIVRLRRRYRECLREHIASTVDGPEEVESEIRDLKQILAG